MPHHRFRCLGCGEIADVEMTTDRVILTLRGDQTHPYKPPAPTCTACGGRNWVLVGSTTELYRWSQRADVCEVTNHTATTVRRYHLYARHPARPEPGKAQVLELVIRACDDHRDVLATEGIRGFFLRVPDEKD